MLLTPTLRQSKKGDFAPTLKVKVPVDSKTDKITAEAYNMQQEQVDITSIEKQNRVMAIVELNQVWFIDKKFGMSVKLLQVLLMPSKTLPRFAFKLPAAETSAPVDDPMAVEGEEEQEEGSDQGTEYEEEEEVDQ
jgi:hypothetical protein